MSGADYWTRLNPPHGSSVWDGGELVSTHSDRDGSERPHEFTEDVADASMCVCGIPALSHDAAMEAPAGPPLHEPADQDGDNVPSDRVRAYAEAIRPEVDGPYVLERVRRAVMAVADREQAALRESARLQTLGVSNYAADVDARRQELWRENEELRATVARVEALRHDWPCSDETCDGDCSGCAYAADLEAALRGPEPTEEQRAVVGRVDVAVEDKGWDRYAPGGDLHDPEPTEEQAALRAENERLTHLLGSHADGHRCTCTLIDPGGTTHPSEWEQDPWCPTHPDVNQIKGELRNLALAWDADADANADTHPKESRAVASCARELLAALRGPEPTEEQAALRAEVERLRDEVQKAQDEAAGWEGRYEALRSERDHFQREVEDHNATCSDLDERLAEAEAAAARVEALAAAWETPPVRINSIRSEVIAHHLREALRGPEPTEDDRVGEAIRADNEQVRIDDFQKWVNPEPTEDGA